MSSLQIVWTKAIKVPRLSVKPKLPPFPEMKRIRPQRELMGLVELAWFIYLHGSWFFFRELSMAICFWSNICWSWENRSLHLTWISQCVNYRLISATWRQQHMAFWVRVQDCFLWIATMRSWNFSWRCVDDKTISFFDTKSSCNRITLGYDREPFHPPSLISIAQFLLYQYNNIST